MNVTVWMRADKFTQQRKQVERLFVQYCDGEGDQMGWVQWREIDDPTEIWYVSNFAISQLQGRAGKEDITQHKIDNEMTALGNRPYVEIVETDDPLAALAAAGLEENSTNYHTP